MFAGKHPVAIIGILAVSIASLSLFLWPDTSPKAELCSLGPIIQAVETPPEKLDMRTRADLAAKQEFERTKDPATGTVPRERLYQAYQELVAAQQKTTTIGGINWTERGPDNVGGRTRAILIDANDLTGNTIFSAGVSGGLWKTTDITASSPVWTPVDDFFSNLAITSLVQDPANPQIMYFGTGEGYFNGDAVRGDGIWKSTNGGTSWTQLPSTAGNLSFAFIQSMVIHPVTGDVFAAARHAVFSNVSGVQRSTDGGATWSHVLTGTTSGGTWAADIVIAPDNDLYASIGIGFNDGIYRSTNSGTSWTQVYTSAGDEQRIELGVAPSDANYIYALVEGSSNAIKKIMRTTNGGTSWPTLSTVSWSDQCAPPVTDFTRNQAFYDLAVAVDPNDRETVWIGGVDLFRSTNGGASWTQLTEWADCSGLEDVHADQHYILYQPGSSDIAYFGNDGGIYRSTNLTAATPTIEGRFNNYNVTQYYSAAMHPDTLSHHFLAGAQDNGSQRYSSPGMNSTVEVTSGDGGFCHIDQDQSSFQWTATTFNNYRRSVDGGASFSSINVDGTGQFINPTDYDNIGNRMFCATSAGNYKVWLDPQSGSSFSNVAVGAFGGGTISAVMCSPNTAERVWFGIDNGRIVRVDNAASAPAATNITSGSFPGADVSSIAVEEGDDSHLLATFFAYGVTSVFESVNGGASWTAVEGNLPDMPIRWAMFRPNDANGALIATELGVWSTDNLNGGSTIWGPSNTGLANVRVDMLQHRVSDSLVAAATHGRGLYTTEAFSPVIANFSAERTCWYATVDLSFTDESLGATSWLWDFGDGGTSTAQNPVHNYAVAGTYTVTLTVNGGADTEVKTNYIRAAAAPAIPYSNNFNADDGCFFPSIISGGGGPWEWGQCNSANLNTGNGTATLEGANSWATVLAGNHGFFTQYALETPPFNMVGGTGTYTLSFRYRAIAGTDAGMNLQVSTDGGTSWAVLGSVGDPLATNWYNNASLTGLGGASGWRQFSFSTFSPTYDITAFTGTPDLRFRFVMGAVGSAADGFQVDEFAISGNPITNLPITAMELSGTWQDATPELAWTTQTETANAGFEVQRSEDGRSFQSVGWVAGAGNSTIAQQYAFADATAMGEAYYYRLQQKDVDGQFSYSNVILLYRDNAPRLGVESVWPNPFQGQLSVELTQLHEGTLTVELLDMAGRKHYQESYPNFSGKRLEMDFAGRGLSHGVYFLRLRSGNSVVIRKVVFAG